MKTYVFEKIIGTEHNCIEVENGRIYALKTVDGKGERVAIPGFIDCHIHGAMGIDVSTCSVNELIYMAEELYKHGTFAFMPTLPALSFEDNVKALKVITEATEIFLTRKDCADILGCHMEGPFMCEKYKGALNDKIFIDATIENWKSLVGPYESTVKRITVDPLRPGVLDMIPYFVSKGIQVSVGHTDSTAEKAEEAFKAGASSVTHLYNAMRGLHHREPGTVGAALASDSIYAELICDFLHVAPEAVKLAISAKTPDRIAVITDSCMAAGMPDGLYKLAGAEIEVLNGEARVPGDGRLASSTVFQDKELKNLISLGFTVEDCSKMLTKNPAVLAGSDDRFNIKEGNPFRLLSVDKSGDITVISE